jgi:hypothetical protein
MELGDLVTLSKKGLGQKQNGHLAWNDVGFIAKELTNNLFYIKWCAADIQTIHFRYELRFAR